MEKKLGVEPSLFQVLWRRIIPLISGVALLSVMWFGSNTYYAGMFAGDEWIKAVGDRAVPSIMDSMESRGRVRILELQEELHASAPEMSAGELLLVRSERGELRGYGDLGVEDQRSLFDAGSERRSAWISRGGRLLQISSAKGPEGELVFVRDVMSQLVRELAEFSIVEVMVFTRRGQSIVNTWDEAGVAATEGVVSVEGLDFGPFLGDAALASVQPVTGTGVVKLTDPYRGYGEYKLGEGLSEFKVFYALRPVTVGAGEDEFIVAAMVPDEVMLKYPKRSIYGGVTILLMMVGLVMFSIYRLTLRHVRPLTRLADRVDALRDTLPTTEAGHRPAADVREAGTFELASLERAVDGLEAQLLLGQSLERQLQESQKLEAVGRLAGGIAHDFNNLLNVVSLNASFIRRHSQGETPLAESIDLIGAAAKAGSNLTRNLMQFCRGERTRATEVTDANEVMASTAKLLERLIAHHITLEVVKTAEPSLVQISAGDLEQVLMNLVLNARDASEIGGRVRMTVEPISGAAEPTFIGADAEGDWVRITVYDAGTGMTAEQRERIFEPFFSTKDEASGTGLGMSVVFGVVTSVGGHVRLDSEVGVGTSVSVFLRPGVSDSRKEPTRRESASRLRQFMGLRCLLVEDDPALRTTLERELRSRGLDVDSADSGEMARDLVEAAALPHDLVISDVTMPGMGGLELARWLRQVAPTTPVVLISGRVQFDAATSPELPENVRRSLGKPVSEAELDEVLRDVLVAGDAHGAPGR